MAVRNESVRLSLHDDFTTGMAKAAAATALLRKQLNNLDGTSLSTSRSLDTSSKDIDRVGSSARRNGPEIDKLSGRLRLLRDAAIVLGPALVPLGAATIPVLTGSIAALGAASGGIGAAILAFNGLGDAMKAIDEAQLEPTAENLQAMRVELEKLGPAGEDFANFLQSIGPEMTELQMAAREGMFPGMEQGIDDMLTRLPLVQEVISRLSKGVGELAADAGADLASDDWTPFLEYVRTTGRPTLEAFGHTIGNVAQGLADMMVAFAPLTRDFSRGLEDMSESFAEWAAGLKDSESFQDFIDYVRESGPQALDMLGSIASAFVAILQAAAPVGSAILPILTTLLKVIGAIADTPLGAAFITAAVAITTYNRAAVLAVGTSTRLRTAMAGINGRTAAAGLGLVALAATDVDEKLGLSNTAMLGMAGAMAGPWGAAVGAGVGLTLDLAAANDSLADAMERADDAIERGSVEDMLRERKKLLDDLAAQDSGGVNTNFDNAGDKLRGLVNDLTGASDEARGKVGALDEALAESGHGFTLFGNHVSTAAIELTAATHAAEDFSAALSELAGWLDKRQALRDYADGIHQIGKGLKDGFGREDVDNIAAAGRNIIQVAEAIKSPGKKAAFLADARADLLELARNSGPKARAEIQKLINKLEEVGLTNAKPDVDVDTRKALGDLNHLLGVLNVFDGKVATARVVTIYERMNRGGGSNVGNTGQLFGEPQARGGTIPGPRYPYRDSVPSMLAPGEEVVANDRGQADRNRALLKAISANRMAGGGTAGSAYPHGMFAGQPFDYSLFTNGIFGATGGLKGLNAQLKMSEKALAKERSQRDDVAGKMSQLSGDVASGLRSDIFAAPDNPWGAGANASASSVLSADIAKGREFIRLVKSLKAKGLDGPALAELLQSGDVERARLYASMSAGDLRQYERLFETRESVLAQAGQVSGQAAFGVEMQQATAELKSANKELREIKAAIKQAAKEAKANSDDNAAKVKAGVNGAAAAGFSKVLK